MSELRAQVVDIQTGEIIHKIHEGDRFKIIKAKHKAKENSNEEPTLYINDEEPFIKVFTKPLFELSKSLSGTESQFVNYLIQYIRYNTGTISYSNGKPVTRAAMSKDTGLNKKTVERLINSLVDKEILGKHKTGRCITLTVNPFIFMRGHKINQTLYEFFANSRWANMYDKPKEK